MNLKPRLKPLQMYKIVMSRKLLSANSSDFYLNPDGVKKIDFLLPDGSTTVMYEVEGDINLTEDQIMDLRFG